MTEELKMKVLNSGFHILFTNTKQLPQESLLYLVKTLIQRFIDIGD